MTQQKGFSLIEVLVSLAIIAVIMLLLVGVLNQMKFLQRKTGAERDTLDAANRALATIAYEIKGAQSIYTPTTTASQLSLQTSRYATGVATYTYIDFFLCGTAICLKKETENPVVITPETVSISSLSFTRISNGSSDSVKISLVATKTNQNSDSGNYSTVTVNSTVALRDY